MKFLFRRHAHPLMADTTGLGLASSAGIRSSQSWVLYMAMSKAKFADDIVSAPL
jgi:hypothetical protein